MIARTISGMRSNCSVLALLRPVNRLPPGCVGSERIETQRQFELVVVEKIHLAVGLAKVEERVIVTFTVEDEEAGKRFIERAEVREIRLEVRFDQIHPSSARIRQVFAAHSPGARRNCGAIETRMNGRLAGHNHLVITCTAKCGVFRLVPHVSGFDRLKRRQCFGGYEQHN